MGVFMKTTTRRNLLKAAAVGGVTAAGLTGFIGAEKASALGAEQKGKGGGGEEEEHDHGHDDGEPLTGKRAQATVSFGQWEVENETVGVNGALPRGPVDRMAAVPNNRNVHKLLPFEVEVEQGGAVSFIISGVHQILIYGPDVDFADVQAAFLAASSPTLPFGPGLINLPKDRIYRGLNPFTLFYQQGTVATQVVDRVESVNFLAPGRYVAVCGLLPHFNDAMHGYVNVTERD
jgi:hypothetical protein